MRIIDPGHTYKLTNLDGHPDEQELYFVKREGPKYPGNKGHHSGTTMQEVLRALIDRADYVNHQTPCWQTKASIFLMGLCVWLFEYRAARRHHRKSPSIHDAIYADRCSKCGHIRCEGACR